MFRSVGFPTPAHAGAVKGAHAEVDQIRLEFVVKTIQPQFAPPIQRQAMGAEIVRLGVYRERHDLERQRESRSYQSHRLGSARCSK